MPDNGVELIDVSNLEVKNDNLESTQDDQDKMDIENQKYSFLDSNQIIELSQDLLSKDELGNSCLEFFKILSKKDLNKHESIVSILKKGGASLRIIDLIEENDDK